MGRQINASVLYVINEIKFSIYRFLTSRSKKNKKQPQPVELGVDWFTSPLEHLMLWQVTVASTRPRLKVDREGGYLDWEGKTTG